MAKRVALRRMRKIVQWLFLLFIAGGVATFFALQTPRVQTWIAHRLAHFLSDEWGTTVKVGKVRINLWAEILVEGLYVEDLHHDTLAVIPKVRLRNFYLNRQTGKFTAQHIALEQPTIHMRRYAGENTMSYAFIIDYFDSPKDTADTSITDVNIQRLQLTNGQVVYYNENRPLRGYGFDWNHFDIRSACMDVTDMVLRGDTATFQLENLAGRDVSGFEIASMQSTVRIDPTGWNLASTNMLSPGSDLCGDLWLGITSIDDFDSFETLVKMEHRFESSKLDIRDIAYFSSDLNGLDKIIELSGVFRGTVAALKGRNVFIRLDENTTFNGSFSMDGLPDIDQTFITLDIKHLTSNKRELDRVPIPPFTEKELLQTPSNFSELGQMHFSGNFTGFINDFVAYGKLKTAIGELNSDISLREDTLRNTYFYRGNLGTNAFDLGTFYDQKNLGLLTSDLTVEGSGLNVDVMDVAFEGNIDQMYLNGYTYSDIYANGTFRQKFFDGIVAVDDPNAMLHFNGQIDFTTKEPILAFSSEIEHLDLRATRLLTEYGYSSISGQIDMNSKGLSAEAFEGTIDIRDLTYCADERDYYIDYVDLKVTRSDQVNIVLTSDIAVGRLTGAVDLPELIPAFQQMASQVIPHYIPPQKEHKSQKFDLEVTILDFSDISGIFIPELYISPGSRLNLSVDENIGEFEIVYTGDSVKYNENKWETLVIDARRPDNSLYLTIQTDRFKTSNNLVFEAFAVDARSERDTVFMDLVWGNPSTRHAGDIKGLLTVRGYQNADFFFGQSSIRVNQEQWQITPRGSIRADSTEILIDSLTITNQEQQLFVNGWLSPQSDRNLDISMSGFDLNNINPFLPEDTQLYGIVSGSSSIRDPFGQLIFLSDLTILNFTLNDYLFGDICLESKWENALKRLRLEGELEKDKLMPLSFAGYYLIDHPTSPLDLVATIKDLDLAFINEFVGQDVLGITGSATGTIAVTGFPDAPQLEGEAALKNAKMFVPYLNTTYALEEGFGIFPDMFTFDRIRIRDEEGAPGFLTGTIMHNNFGEWNFDVVVELETPMLVMNTDEEMNSLYYGKAYTTGEVNISGFEEQLDFTLNLRSEKGTRLAMPMSSSEDLSFENFIRFVSKDSVPADAPLDLSGINLKFDLDITPAAQLEIIFDKAVGDVMRGRGQGHLNMEINNLSTFSMYGVIELVEGNYLFTLKNLLNKEFVVKPGGTLSWYGDPFAADLNLQAVYKVSASLAEVIPDNTMAAGQRVPVDLYLNLTGKMFNPNVDFDISLPQVDQITRSRLESVISTDQEKARQAFALLVLRRFVAPPNVTSATTALADAGNSLADNSSELLTNQISNWLSQISNDFNLGFNYRPGDEISNEEIALALSTQMFNDRLSLSGNFGVSRGNTANANPTNYIGDIRIEYKITRDGKIRLLVYNESNDFRMAAVQNSLYTQGVGILYQEEFDTMDEFYCAFRNLFRRTDYRIKCEDIP
jgi:hypothetical protein